MLSLFFKQKGFYCTAERNPKKGEEYLQRLYWPQQLEKEQDRASNLLPVVSLLVDFPDHVINDSDLMISQRVLGLSIQHSKGAAHDTWYDTDYRIHNTHERMDNTGSKRHETEYQIQKT